MGVGFGYEDCSYPTTIDYLAGEKFKARFNTGLTPPSTRMLDCLEGEKRREVDVSL